MTNHPLHSKKLTLTLDHHPIKRKGFGRDAHLRKQFVLCPERQVGFGWLSECGSQDPRVSGEGTRAFLQLPDRPTC